jgi:3-oxoacyl-[acyl-carrier protein] reductase
MNLVNITEVQNYLNNFKEEVDILINNAGINEPNNILDINAEELINDFNINFLSHFLISQFFLKRFIKNKKGIIINIGSIRITELKDNRFKYTLSKSSMHTLTKYIVKETSKYNILCNTISPGYVETDMLYKNNDEKKIKEMVESVPIKRFVSPHEISELVYFLSIKNTYINGQNIIIDGGLTCI